LEKVKLDENIEKFKQMVAGEGEVKIDCWGKKRLAYQIAGKREGVYVIMNFKADISKVRELERNFKISEDVLRHILIKKEKPVPESSSGQALTAPDSIKGRK